MLNKLELNSSASIRYNLYLIDEGVFNSDLSATSQVAKYARFPLTWPKTLTSKSKETYTA